MGGGNGRPIVKYRDSVWSSVQKVEPIKMSFGLWARMVPRNHVVDGGPDVLRDVAMATNFWISLGYNFCCIIASDTLFDSGVGFLGSNNPMKTSPISRF